CQADAHAHVARRARHRQRFLDIRPATLHPRVMHHHPGSALARRAREGRGRAQPRIDTRQHAKPGEPGLQRLIGRAQRGAAKGAGMVVGIDQRGQREASRAGRRAG
ncbi:MAG: hypothetical protein ACK56I_34800, partial [bacterium]